MAVVGIVGLGLIGGSLGAALRRRGYEVVGLTRSASVAKEAQRRRIVSRASTDPAVLSEADVVVLAVPVQSTGDVVKKIKRFLKPGTVLTDAGSVKSSVAKAVRAALASRPDINFVGAHPMAGSEKSGIKFADAGLFRKSICVISSEKPTRASRQVEALWAAAGARPIRLSAQDHDRFLAVTSHLPHLLAFALYEEVFKLARKNSRVRSLVAGSFRDMTRIAASNPDVWAGIFESNDAALRDSWRVFQWHVNKFLTKRSRSLRNNLAFLSSSRRKWKLT